MNTERMPFGKHKGEPLSRVPGSYLAWVLRNCTNMNPWLRRCIQNELYRREEDEPPPRQRYEPSPPRQQSLVDWNAILSGWYRQLVLDFHPDRGGSTEAMAAINEANHRLRKLVGV